MVSNSGSLHNSILRSKRTLGTAQSHINGYRFSLESPQLTLTIFFFFEKELCVHSRKKKKSNKNTGLIIKCVVAKC